MKKLTLARLSLIPAFVAATLPAHAEVPVAVTTAITTAGTDLVAVITAIIVAMVAFWGMRKIAQKFGWI